MKNINLKTKLILVGVIVLLIPLCTLGIISIYQSTNALTDLMHEQLTRRTDEISGSIYNVLSKEEKFVLGMSVNPITKDALSSGKYTDLNRMLTAILNTKGLGETYQVLWVSGTDGVVKAASAPEYLDLDLSDREYLQTALSGRVNIGQAALNKVTKEPFIPVAAPVYSDDGRIVGAAASIMHLDFLWELIKDSTIGETGYAFVTDANGLFIAHPDPSTLFETELSELSGMQEITRRFMARESGYEGYVYKGIAKTSGFAVVDEAEWGVFLTLPDEEFLAASSTIRTLLIIVAAVSFGVAFLVFYIFAVSITTPIRKIVGFANEIADGLLYTSVDIDQKDEIGRMAAALKQMQLKLSEVVEGVIDSSAQVSSGSSQLAQSSQQLSTGATDQAANAEEVSSSVEQMGANIQQNTDNAAKTEEIASQAAVDIEDGGAAVVEAVEAMNEIAAKINIIEEIARNTNLLSLNAAIEAARAGEHGKGFAVVASEVGKLAATSQKAALEIQELARGSVEKADAAGERIQKVVPDIRKTAELVAEISASSHEQNTGADQINSAMIQLDHVIQQNAAASEEAASMAEELSAQAERLQQTMLFFKIDASASASASAKETVDNSQSTKPKARIAAPEQKESTQVTLKAPAQGSPKVVNQPELPEAAEVDDGLDSDFIEF